ncbi:glutathione peroxidase [Mangrovitalea sediminis]|uniref:glutathione peroxidase n=1 Tax=Mangrovitalea sediminis TaxID=1982043 RepID=UPI000BE5681B|nr:glutathione peroxidase [Mangrovitalea sediminis]
MTTLHDFTLTAIDGSAMPLDQLRGKTVLLVNVASECGLTPQYQGLENLYREFADQGLVVVGLPCNQFGGQEPGTEAEIAAFCQSRFDVTFPMTGKIEVNGAGRHPLYQWLIGDGDDIRWNFEKFLVDSHGRVVERFDPRTTPEDPALREKLTATLAAAS